MITEFISLIDQATSAQQVKDILALCEKVWDDDRTLLSGDDWEALSLAVTKWKKARENNQAIVTPSR